MSSSPRKLACHPANANKALSVQNTSIVLCIKAGKPLEDQESNENLQRRFWITSLADRQPEKLKRPYHLIRRKYSKQSSCDSWHKSSAYRYGHHECGRHFCINQCCRHIQTMHPFHSPLKRAAWIPRWMTVMAQEYTGDTFIYREDTRTWTLIIGRITRILSPAEYALTCMFIDVA